ncbi:hypothetical protein T484DRAFT_1825393 [Baffinella frigidus]|nr:hypothetical protein T484DRAFT_1825393 [Cryptophyta sp. CCMP2293]
MDPAGESSGEVAAPGHAKHHCRRCGQGFCSACSQARAPVPLHGWTKPESAAQEALGGGDQLYAEDSDDSEVLVVDADPATLPHETLQVHPYHARLVNVRVTGHADAEANCPR